MLSLNFTHDSNYYAVPVAAKKVKKFTSGSITYHAGIKSSSLRKCYLLGLFALFTVSLSAQALNNPVYANVQVAGAGGTATYSPNNAATGGAVASTHTGTTTITTDATLGSSTVTLRLEFTGATIPANTATYVQVSNNAALGLSLIAYTTLTGTTTAGGSSALVVGPDGLQYIAITPTIAYQSVVVGISGPGLYGTTTLGINYAFYNTLVPADCGRPTGASSYATGIPLGLSVVSPEKAINASATDYSSFQSVVGVGVLATINQMLYFNGPANVGDGIGLLLGNPSQLLSINVAGSVQFQAYNGSVAVGVAATVPMGLINLFNNGTTISMPYYPVDGSGNAVTFDRLLISVTLPVSVSVASEYLRVYDVQRIPAAPATANFSVYASSISGGKIAGVQSPQSKIANIGTLTYRWYATANSTNVLTTTTSVDSGVALGSNGLNVPPVAGVYTYYVNASKSCSGDTSGYRTAVNVTVTPDVLVQVKVFLQGAYSSGALMRNDLKKAVTANGTSIISLVQPYGTGQSAKATYKGLEHVAALPSNMVDWVLVQLRSTATGTTIMTRAGILLQDGSVVDTTAGFATPLSFGIASGSYYIVVRQRNSLAVMSANAQALSTTATTYDFTLGNGQAYNLDGNNTSMVALGNGKYALWGGDVNMDGMVVLTGTGNDFDQLLISLGGDYYNYISPSYLSSDVNMDNVTTVTGTGNDFDWIIANVLAGNIYSYLSEQVP